MSWVVPTPGRPTVTYASGYYSMEWRDDRQSGLVTNVAPWPEYKFGLQGTEIKYRYGWNHHPVTFAPHNAKELLMGANVLFETLDEGAHWKVISPDLTRNDTTKEQRPGGPISADVTGEEMFGTISSIAFSPLTDNVIWTGSDDGLVHVTTDAGAHWSEVRPPALPTWSTITCIEPSHTTAGSAYISASRFDWDDFHPYVYKTSDYGKHWTEIATGLPADQYVESVRQDPDKPDLLFAGTSASAYFSLDGGKQWKPLTLNLPAVRVNDIEIQPEQHAVVLATFGRGFWVLDDLQFLEQLGTGRAADVANDAPYLFKPQQAWLTSRGGGRGGAGGASLAPGVTVFFHLPSDYNGSTPVKLDFTTASGALIRSVTLHPRSSTRGESAAENPAAGGRGRQAPRQETAEPGMNRFQWDMRYPEAAEVKGIYHSGFSASNPIGPEVVPGSYNVTLSYGGTTQKQPFVIKLDPRLKTTPAELQQRFALLMRLHDAVNGLDTTLNKAIAMRDSLEKTAANGSAAGGRARPALENLNRDNHNLLDLRIHIGEGRARPTAGGASIGRRLLQRIAHGNRLVQRRVEPVHRVVQTHEQSEALLQLRWRSLESRIELDHERLLLRRAAVAQRHVVAPRHYFRTDRIGGRKPGVIDALHLGCFRVARVPLEAVQPGLRRLLTRLLPPSSACGGVLRGRLTARARPRMKRDAPNQRAARGRKVELHWR